MTVGIDLGTTFSALAHVNNAGSPVLVPDRNDAARYHTPSIIHISDRGCFVGEVVEQMLSDDPTIPVCRFAKAGMGRPDSIYHDTKGQPWGAEAVSALILRKLREDALMAGLTIDKCVISVPAHFNELEKRSTVNAARLAGLPCVGLVEEPVAAATFAAASGSSGDKTLFVFDLGGGTLDATVLHSSPEGLYVIATEGAPHLGGRNFDEVLMDMVLEQYLALFSHDPSQDTAAMQSLRTFATRTKIELSNPRTLHAARPVMLCGRSMRFTISRSQFEAAAAALIDRCLETCRRALRAAALSWNQIDELVLVGGGSLLPAVEQAVVKDSGLPPERIRRNQPHSSVAYGVALLAERQFGNRDTIAPPLLQSVSTNELGLRMLNPKTRQTYFHVLIPRNTPLPVSQPAEIYTSHDAQEHIIIEVLQRKDDQQAPQPMGRLRFGPLGQREMGYPVRITLSYNAVGRVHVTAADGRTGTAISEEVCTPDDADLAASHETVMALSIVS